MKNSKSKHFLTIIDRGYQEKNNCSITAFSIQKAKEDNEKDSTDHFVPCTMSNVKKRMNVPRFPY